MIVEQYRNAVQLAKDAGFDGIELLSQGYVTPIVQTRTVNSD